MKIAVRHTSLAAFDQVKAGTLGRQQAQIVGHMAHHAHRDWSRAELSEALGMSLQSVCGRVNELVKAGVLRDEKTRSCGVTGRTVHALELAPVQAEMDLAA